MTVLKRNLECKINDLLDIFPAVVIIGPRQCGKTSLSKCLRPDWKYFDLESAKTYDHISMDLSFFFKENKRHLIIDEAQKYPKLFNELRGVIDLDRKTNNRFILTGSSSPELLKNVSESLAGRVAIIELATLKANEVYSKKLSEFYKIINKKITNKTFEDLKCLPRLHSHEEIKEHFLKGGYPDACLANSQFKYDQWMDNYFTTYINRDIRSLFPKLDLVKFRRFTGILCNLSGQIINKSNIARAIEVDDKTIKDYLDIANGTFVWRTINSFEQNKSKSIIKMPKGGYRDSGLLNYQRKIKTMDDLDISSTIGHDFEHFIIEELIKGIHASRITNWDYYYYRTRGGAEVDLILEGPFGIIPIEIKYGMKIPARSLTSLSNFIKSNNLPMGIVINNGDEIQMLKEKIIQIPIQFL